MGNAVNGVERSRYPLGKLKSIEIYRKAYRKIKEKEATLEKQVAKFYSNYIRGSCGGFLFKDPKILIPGMNFTS